MSTTALCICHHWDDQHADMGVAGKPCSVPSCWCKGAGFFPVARGSRHRPGPSTHAFPDLVHNLRPGQRILTVYRGDGRIGLSPRLADSLIAEVEKVSWSGEGDLWHVITDLGLLPLVKGRSSVRVVNKS